MQTVAQRVQLQNNVNINSFTRYGTKEKIHHMIRNGMALSVLFYSDSTTNETIIGCIISQCSSWYFCILDIYGPLHPI